MWVDGVKLKEVSKWYSQVSGQDDPLHVPYGLAVVPRELRGRSSQVIARAIVQSAFINSVIAEGAINAVG